MPLYGIEDAISALGSYLGLNIPGKVAALNAEYADAVVLTAPASFFTSEIIEPNTFPVAMILGDRSDIVQADASSITQQHHVSIVLYDVETGDIASAHPRLRQRIYRFGRALLEVILAGQAAGLISVANTVPYTVLLERTPFFDWTPVARRRGDALNIGGLHAGVLVQATELR